MTSIGNNAFFNCGGLTSVEIPDSVTSIGSNAFFNCRGLTSVEIPDSVTSIGGSAFQGCSSLASVKIPDGIVTINSYVFSNCSSLTSITIPDSVTSIGQGAFYNCSALTDVYYGGSRAEWNKIRIDAYYNDQLRGATIHYAKTDPTATPTQTPMPTPIATPFPGPTATPAEPSVPTSGTCGENLTWKIEDGVLTISGTGAMMDYSWCQGPPVPWGAQFKSVVIESGVTSIGNSAFYGFSLTSITIPDSVTSIGDYAFGRGSLTSITIPDGVTSIGNGAFEYCSALADVYYGGSRVEWNKIGIGRNNYQLTGATIHYAKTDPTATPTQTPMPTPIVTPNPTATPAEPPVPTSGTCGENLTWKIEDGVLTISGTGAMTDYSPIQGPQLPWAAAKIKSVVIESSVTSIGDFAFVGQVGLTSITIPDSVTSIGDYAFYNCSSLASIAIPNSITSIGQGAFSGCSSLTSITIPDGVTSIGSNIFYGCSSLKSITIPDSVTTICSDAFRNCTSLTSVTIPASMASIGSHAFYKCTALKDVYYSSCSETKWNSITVGSDNDPLKNATIHYSDHRWDEGVITKPATRTEEGEKTFTCTICQTTRTETIPALTPEPDSVDLNEIAKDFDGSSIGVDVDGKTVYPNGEGNYPRLTVPEGTTTLISVSTCNLPEGVDPHTRYPVSMAVYKATNTDGTTSVERISEMDDLLRYAGSSIRITGNKGIRLITGINASLKSALTSEGVAGYTLEEYGTLLCWASEVQNGSLSLSDAYARHNYAYSLANGTDPVFRYAGDVVQYTNVLVGFSNEQCVDDIAMRPYITLRDADGNTYTLYGGIVNRSIGYIAYQNRGAFTPGTNAYNYIWDIIHFVYGDAYDEDYKG